MCTGVGVAAVPGWPGEKAGRAGDRTEVEEEEVVRRRFSFSLSPEEELLPMLARDTRPFLLADKIIVVNNFDKTEHYTEQERWMYGLYRYGIHRTYV